MLEKMFDTWWRDNRDRFAATPLMQQCFEAGFWAAMQIVVRALAFGFTALVLLMLFGLLAGCEDRYRYYCQNPENFHAEQCQKPRCQFTQQCPEYLVAPILEKQIPTTPPQDAAK